MQLPSKFWADPGTRHFAPLAASEVIGQAVAVLPVTAIAQHGPHLPVSVDATIVDCVIAAALPHLPAALPVLFLPTQQVGRSPEHIRFPGTLTLSAQTLMAVWMELGACVARAGLRKLVLFNSHGGQISVMDIVARDLRTAHDLIVYSANWFTLPLGDTVLGLFPPEEHRFGIHGGDIETSMMLAARSDLVDMAQARHFHSSAETCATAAGGQPSATVDAAVHTAGFLSRVDVPGWLPHWVTGAQDLSAVPACLVTMAAGQVT